MRTARLLPVAFSLASCLLLSFGCSDNRGESGDSGVDGDADQASDADTDADRTSDADDVDSPNACGGSAMLSDPDAPEEAAEPGQACGPCGAGLLICDSPDSLTCVGTEEQNSCGGCELLAHTPESACGPCGEGVWSCQDTEAVACVDARPPNACGGCAALEEEPETSCGTDEAPATWHCVSPEEIRCIEDDANVCGGEIALDGLPGELCGTCGRGTLVCDGVDALLCENAERGVNACGSCGGLVGVPGEPCGACGGVWECDDEGELRCTEAPNACGGCGPLDGTPGESCEGGSWSCDIASGDVVCVEDRNVCGGESPLDELPGEACGVCLDGLLVCATPESTACVGASEPNACGGCGLLPGEPGETCGSNARWECDGDALVCVVSDAPERNDCGGTNVLDGAPGDACGLCESGALECAGANALACVGEADEAEFLWWIDGDDDGHGDRDATEQVLLCETPTSGYARTNDDCDDANGAIYPGAIDEPDTEPVDDNCDGRDGDLATDQYVSAGASGEDLQAAVDACVGVAGCDVLVEDGDFAFAAPLEARAGVRLFGGYAARLDLDGVDGEEPFSDRCFGDDAWSWSGVYGESTECATILRATAEADTTVVAVEAHGAVLDGVRVEGSTAPGGGESTYVVRVVDTDPFRIQRSRIVAGPGGADLTAGHGANGANGATPVFRTGGSSSCGATGGDGASGGDLEICSGGSCTLIPGWPPATRGVSADGLYAAPGGDGDPRYQSVCDYANCDVDGEDGENGTDGAAGSCRGGGSVSNGMGALTTEARWTDPSSSGGGRGRNGCGGGGGGHSGGAYC